MRTKSKIITGIFSLSKKATYHVLILMDLLRGLDFNRTVTEQINGYYYYECTHLSMQHMLRRICREATKEDRILDCGCGKGRMLWFFSKFDFQKVDGIEHNPNLAAIARQNMDKLKVAARVIGMDVCDFADWENYTWFYFYNPFPDRVMSICLRNMVESVRKRPRTLHVIYVNPRFHHLLLEYGFKELAVEHGILEKLVLPYLSVLKRYRYEP